MTNYEQGIVILLLNLMVEILVAPDQRIHLHFEWDLLRPRKQEVVIY